MRNRVLPSVLIISLALLSAACRHNVDPNPQTPSQKVAVYNASLAKATRAATEGVIGLQKTGTVTASQARTVLQFCELLANTSEAVRIAMIQSSDWPATAAQIQKVLANVNVDAWLKQAKVDNQQIIALLQAVSSTIILIQYEVKQ